MVFQWLRPCISQVRGPGFEHSLLGEIRSYKACGTAKNRYKHNKLNYNNEYAGKDYAPI